MRQGRNPDNERTSRGIWIAVLAVSLLACAYTALWRVHVESQARRVELAMDFGDFSAMAKAYNYSQEQLLIGLRRSGLTSLAVAEELGSAVNSGNSAILISGRQLIDNARLSSVSQATLAGLLRAGQVKTDEVYLLVYDAREIPRYRAALARHFRPESIRRPAANVFALRSQIDYFSGLGLGLPVDSVALASRLGLLLVPRIQNDDRYNAHSIDALLRSLQGERQRVSTVVFFGQRNEVLGYPNHLDDTAGSLARYGFSFGAIEAYDRAQVQKGSEGLGERIPAQTTRVQAISKAELDKLDLPTVVARYLLGVRERNVRVVYLRPLLHPNGAMSIEQTNLDMVRQIAAGLRSRGFALGRATPVRNIVLSWVIVMLASLAVPAFTLLLLQAFGLACARYALPIFSLDVLPLLGGYLTHHDLMARKCIALWGAIVFATGAVVAVSGSFRRQPPVRFGERVLAGLRTMFTATSVSLAGALVVVGLLSVAVLMEEIQSFSGVKAVIVVPPVAALCLYLYTYRFRNDPLDARMSMLAPVRLYALLTGFALLAAGFLYISRSGNQSDIAPSTFELSLRSGLTTVLGVRPRFKEFMIGFPFMMLLSSLRLEHRRAVGWLFALAIGIGTADIIDTFSHLHTPLLVSLVRLFNGLVIGGGLGTVAIALYGIFAKRRTQTPS